MPSGSTVALTDTWSSRRTRFGGISSGTGNILSTWDLKSMSHKLPIGGNGDNGGPFSIDKVTYNVSPAMVNEPPGSVNAYYQGKMWPTQLLYVADTSGGSSHPSDQKIDSDGATAISRVEPTNPAFDLGVALGELRNDGLPSIVGLETLKNRSNLARSAGSEFLNVEFGWKPLVSDLRNLARAVNESDKIIQSYRAGSDKKIRRRYAFPTEEFTRQAASGSGGAGPMYFSGFGSVTHSRFTGSGSLSEIYRQRRWFSGAFRYHVPVSDDMLGKLSYWRSMSNKLLGTSITPELVWNLAPWTWAVDWFTNAGDVLHNISAMGRDGLVLQYGYSMAETIREVHKTGSFTAYDGPHTASISKIEKHAKRRKASPYGFGFDFSTITGRQTAILAALGLSRVGR